MTLEVEVERNWELEDVADDDELGSGLGDNRDVSHELFIN